MVWASVSPVASSTLTASSTSDLAVAVERQLDCDQVADDELHGVDPGVELAGAGAVAAGERRSSPASGPTARPARTRRAAPVGVVSSWGMSTLATGAPRSSSTTAGAGTGIMPWADRVIPTPVATGPACTTSTPSSSSAAHVPTTSTMASMPPTSWKWTWLRRPAVEACPRPRRAGRTRRARGRGRGRAAGPPRSAPVMCSAVRTTWVSSDAAPRRGWRRCRRAGRPRSRGASRRPAAGRASARTSSTSAPASMHAPSAMSPAMPENGWNQATVAHRSPLTSRARRRRGRARRAAGGWRRPRRSRCRCRRR